MIEIASRQNRVKRLDNARYHGGRRHPSDIVYLAAHATLGGSFEHSSVPYMNRDLDDPKGPQKQTSYHYGIERDGSIIRTLDPLVISYGCGDSGWPNPVHWSLGGNHRSLNFKSISVAYALEFGEEVHPEQKLSGLWLFRTLMELYDIPPSDVLAHKEISPGRKFDPDTVDMNAFRRELAEVRLLAA